MDETLAFWALGGAAFAATLPRLIRRLELSRAKHPSLTGHSRMAKRVASWLPGYAYGEERFFNSDGAPAEVAAQRRQALQRLGDTLVARCPRTLAPATACPTCSSPAPTACRSSTARCCASMCRWAPSWKPPKASP